jgi:hypothetical protein
VLLLIIHSLQIVLFLDAILYLVKSLNVVVMIVKVVILGVRRLTSGRNGQAGGRACPLHQVRIGHIGHIL